MILGHKKGRLLHEYMRKLATREYAVFGLKRDYHGG